MSAFPRQRFSRLLWFSILMIVATACATSPRATSSNSTQVAPSSSAPVAPSSGPSATVVVTASPTPALETIAGLTGSAPMIDADALTTTLAGLSAQGAAVLCANEPTSRLERPTGQALSTIEKTADRWVSCLEDVALAWANYLENPSPNHAAVVKAVYGYAAGALGSDGKAYLDGALSRLDWPSVPEPSAHPGLEDLASLKTAATQNAAIAARHAQLRDAYAANLPTLVAAIVGPCAGRCRVILADDYRSDVFDVVTPVANCEVYTAECGSAARAVWQMYLATGDSSFYDIVVGLRDQFVWRGMLGGGWTLSGIREAFLQDFDNL